MPIDTQPSQRAPLENESAIFASIRVIDLTQGMAGSLVTMILADYGAEVIRLEPPGGDAMWAHPAYLLWQRGKQSVNIDWASEAGRDQARMLVNGADIFIETRPPGEAGRLGLSYEGASAANPALIYLSVSAWTNLVGREAILSYLSRDTVRGTVCPIITNLLIDVDGQRASSECLMSALVWAGGHTLIGEYRDTYRYDGRWRFVSRIYTMFRACKP